MLSYGGGGFTAGTYNTLGGNGGAGYTGYGNGGSGGNGNVVVYDYGTIPPLDIITLPSISQSTSGVLDAGQTVTFSTSFAGGVSPYTYNWIVSNTISGSLVANSLYASSLTSNSFAWTIPSSAAGNTVNANVIITDSLASSSQGSHATVNSIESGTITVKTAPSVISLAPSATTLDSGQSVTYNAEITGGTGPFTANLVIGGTTVNTITGISAGGVFTFGSVIPPAGTDTYNVIATDVGTSIPFVFNSISNTITVNAAPSSSSGGGGGPAKYAFVLSDNINSTAASTNPVYVLYASSGNINYYQNQLPVTLSLLTPYLNVSWACNISIGASTYAYQNDVYGLGFGIPCGKYYTTYTPNIESIYALLSASTKENVTTTSTTTIQSTTTIPQLPSGRSITSNVLVSSLAPVSINFQNMKTTFVLTTLSKTPVHMVVNVTNATSVPLQPVANYTLISAFNISVSTSANVTVNVIEQYPCGVYSSLIRPFEFTNGTWSMITPFEVNATACTALFTVPKDPIVGIFQKIVTTTTITTTTTISVNTTTVPTIVAQGTALKSSTALIIAIAAIAAVIILLLLMLRYHLRKVRRRAKKKFKSH